ncbi:MAG: hypothetical protein IAE82_08325 [Opitutaceae bacterium]|nr:hypothetical protein [Opitutaceae bacterium]
MQLFVFSITVDWRSLEAEVSTATGRSNCVLTPHVLFPYERARLMRLGGASWTFRTFHDLLDADATEFCDEEADRQMLELYGRREGRVTEYFAAIKRVKNRLLLARLQEEFEIADGVVLSDDLGIEASIWLAAGLRSRIPSGASPNRPPLWRRVRRFFAGRVPCHYLEWSGESWILIGRPERVGQYLDAGSAVLRPAGRSVTALISYVLAIGQSGKLGPRPLCLLLWIVRIARNAMNMRVCRMAATVHEDSQVAAMLGTALGLEYVNLQDSFLPEYYPSRYLLYRPWVRRYYVWDQFSQGIFRRHGLESNVWSAYRSWVLPAIKSSSLRTAFRIVYLASGAGDWTAAKNRSDEDLALALLLEVAKRRPDLALRYRPHPLWLHPEHQGLNSIQRAITTIEESGMPNIMVSQGARMDGRQFSLTGNLSAVSSSVDEDIAWADLVVGEHSQTMLVAARRGKVIAGINVSRHPPFFRDYAALGFPLLTSAQDLITLVNRMQTDASFADNYNATILRHNQANCGANSSLAAGRF